MASKEPEDTITAVGPGSDEEVDEPQTRGVNGTASAGDDYDYPAEDEDERRAQGEERTGHAEEQEDPDEGLNRQQRKRRHKREQRERQQRELDFLRSRNAQLERAQSQRMAEIETRQTQSDVLAIDGRISQAENDVREAETLFQQALENKDSAATTEALRVRDQLRDGLNQLRATKQNAMRQAQARQRAAQQPAPAPIPQRAQEWLRDNPWFNPTSPDEDTSIAQAVELRLFQEGRLDPNGDEYYTELDRRLARRLPEHYRDEEEDDRDEQERDERPVRRNGSNRNGGEQRRSRGPTFKVGGRERPLRKGEVYIDEDRKQAMIEKGVWDDPVLRERQLKYYQQYDREAGRRRR